MRRFFEDLLLCEAVGPEREAQSAAVISVVRTTLVVAVSWIAAHTAAIALGLFGSSVSLVLILAIAAWLAFANLGAGGTGRVVSRYGDRQQLAILIGLLPTSILRNPETPTGMLALVQALLVVGLLLPWSTAIQRTVRGHTRQRSTELGAYLVALLALMGAVAWLRVASGGSLYEIGAESSLPELLMTTALVASAPLLLAWGGCRALTPEQSRELWEQEQATRRSRSEPRAWSRPEITRGALRTGSTPSYSAACALWLIVAIADVAWHALL